MADIDTTNYQLVAVSSKGITVMAPRVHMTPEEALLQAAWLVVLAEHQATHSFADVLEAVQRT